MFPWRRLIEWTLITWRRVCYKVTSLVSNILASILVSIFVPILVFIYVPILLVSIFVPILVPTYTSSKTSPLYLFQYYSLYLLVPILLYVYWQWHHQRSWKCLLKINLTDPQAPLTKEIDTITSHISSKIEF